MLEGALDSTKEHRHSSKLHPRQQNSTAHGSAEVGLTPGKLDLLETAIETYNLLLGSPEPPVAKKPP